MNIVNIVLFWIFFGFWSSYLAKKRDRNPRLWFLLGILLGIVGVIVIALLPRVERRRAEKTIVVEPVVVEPPKWYYLDHEKKHFGPFTVEQLREKEGINEATFLWCEGMQEWKRLRELPELLKVMQIPDHNIAYS